MDAARARAVDDVGRRLRALAARAPQERRDAAQALRDLQQLERLARKLVEEVRREAEALVRQPPT